VKETGKTSQVENQLERHEKAVVALHDIITALEERLTTVLVPKGPENDMKEEEANLVHLALRLSSIAGGTMDAFRHIQDILERLEL